MKSILFIDMQIDDVEGKTPDNIIYMITKILKDLDKNLTIVKQKSDFQLEIKIRNISITPVQEEYADNAFFKSMPISLN